MMDKIIFKIKNVPLPVAVYELFSMREGEVHLLVYIHTYYKKNFADYII